MKVGLQLGAWLCGVALSAALVVPCAGAQSNRPPARQPQPQASRPPQNNSRPPANTYHPQNLPPRQDSRGGGNANRQPANPPRNDSRGNGRDNAGNTRRDDRAQNQYRQQRPAVPPPNVQDRLRNMSPQQRSQLAETQRKFNQLPPQKQEEMRRAANNWTRLTPEQQNHLKNDVIPKWKQLPPDRQKAIQQRLGVLQNMPESARNRHLNDPTFTRGMSDDDKQMLRDLSHEHVGSPDRPPE
jgi:Protein of unknown function (DUF3106)